MRGTRSGIWRSERRRDAVGRIYNRSILICSCQHEREYLLSMAPSKAEHRTCGQRNVPSDCGS